MGKMSELDAVLHEFHAAAKALIGAADSLKAFYSQPAEPPAPEEPKPKPQKPAKVTLEQVRAVLAEKSRDGHTAKVRELLERYGASKLSEIDPAKYAALHEEGAVLGNG